MHMTHRHLPTNDDLTHLVVRLENALNSNPPRKINALFLFERSLRKSLALKKIKCPTVWCAVVIHQRDNVVGVFLFLGILLWRLTVRVRNPGWHCGLYWRHL